MLHAQAELGLAFRFHTPVGFPLPYQRSTIWTLLLQMVVTGVLAWLDFKHNRYAAAGPRVQSMCFCTRPLVCALATLSMAELC